MATIRDAVNATATSASRPPNRRQKALTEQHQREDAARLRAFAAFDNFSDRELLRLAQASHHHSTSTAWPLIHEHTPSDACYILLSGEVGVYVGHDRIATLGPGEVIGESALRTGRLRSATVTTTGAAEVLRIGRDDLARLLDEIPPCGRPSTRRSPSMCPSPTPSRRRRPNRSAPGCTPPSRRRWSSVSNMPPRWPGSASRTPWRTRSPSGRSATAATPPADG